MTVSKYFSSEHRLFNFLYSKAFCDGLSFDCSYSAESILKIWKVPSLLPVKTYPFTDVEHLTMAKLADLQPWALNYLLFENESTDLTWTVPSSPPLTNPFMQQNQLEIARSWAYISSRGLGIANFVLKSTLAINSSGCLYFLIILSSPVVMIYPDGSEDTNFWSRSVLKAYVSH